MLIRVNELRAENGLNPLELDEKLIDLAFAKAEDWNLGGYSKDADAGDGATSYHVSPRYGSARQMYKTMFGEYKAISENFARSSVQPNDVTELFYNWENSEGHLRAMLQPHLTKMGFGYVIISGTKDEFNTVHVALLEMY